MAQSLHHVIPSIKKKNIQQQKPIHQFKISKNHRRTTSAPLPNQQQLSLNVLLDAIDLDQQMRHFFKSEVLKSKNRSSPFVLPMIMMARRRAKSAPGAPPSYHYQRAFQSKWFVAHETVTSESVAQEVAQRIVQKHIETVKSKE